MRSYKAPLLIIAAIVVVVLLVIGYLMIRGGGQTEQTNLTTATVAKGTVDSTLSATGTIISANQVDLNFEDPGKLTSLSVGLNSAVANGQELARLDPTAANLDEEILISSIDGTVIQIGAKVGEQLGTTAAQTKSTGTTTSGSPAIDTTGFITVADTANLQVKIGIDQADIANVAAGQAVTISLDAIPDKDFGGNIVSIDPIPTNNQNVITYTVYASVISPDTRVRLGMSANVRLDMGKKENVLIVPNLAVKTVDGQRSVTRIVNGKQVDTKVTVGISDDKNTEIKSGLSEGDKVIVGSISLTSSSDSSSTGGRGFFGPR